MKIKLFLFLLLVILCSSCAYTHYKAMNFKPDPNSQLVKHSFNYQKTMRHYYKYR